MDPRRFSGLSHDDQYEKLEAILRADGAVWPAIEGARDLDLPDWMIVSGAIYNSVWNALTGRAAGNGINDVDLFYFDDTDLSWEAEDAVIRRGETHFAGLNLPVEIRNQARVHVWYPKRFGRSCPVYSSSAHSLGFFASKTHAVGVRLKPDDTLDIVAPFGLDDIFSLRITPNHALDNEETHLLKGRRAQSVWPEVVLEGW